MPIDFFVGHPTYRLLPRKEILDASTKVLVPEKRDYDLDKQSRHPLTYGSDQGSLWVRESIADWTNRLFNLTADEKIKASYINLTGGASYGVLNGLLQTTLAQTGYTRQGFIVTPTYYLINNCFIDAGFGGKITAIDENHGLLDLKYLEDQLIKYENQDPVNDSLKIIDHEPAKKVYRYVFWCVPTFSNPGGVTIPENTRRKLIELARKYDILIISDEVYELLDFKNREKIKRFDMLDRETLPKDNLYGNTLTNMTFLKLVAPGIRTGFQITATEKLAFQLCQGGANVSGGSPSQLNANIVGELIKSGDLDRLISSLNSVYGERARVAVAAIEKYLPPGTKYQGGDGGYFIWVTLPENYDSRAIVKLASAKGLRLAGGDNFEVAGDERGWGKTSVRVSVSSEEAEQIEEGIKIWGQVAQESLKK